MIASGIGMACLMEANLVTAFAFGLKNHCFATAMILQFDLVKNFYRGLVEPKKNVVKC
jgi:hypothetical protein